MNEKTSTVEEVNSGNLPDNIYASVVRSLYADAQTLLVGVLSVAVAPLVLYWKGGDKIQLVFSAFFLVIGIFRLLLAKEFDFRIRDDSTREEFHKWENRYVLMSSLYVSLLGGWFLVGVMRSADPFVEILSLSLVLCYLSGVIGRNFGSSKLVLVQVLIGSSLIIAGLLGSGGVYNIVLATFLLPFFLAIKLMSARLREMLHTAEITAQANRIIANRFDTALENVMHGIAMFSRDGTITVANERFLTLAGLEGEDIIGSDVSILNATGDIADKDEAFSARIKTYLNSNHSQKFTFQLNGGRTIEADYNSMEEGGVVVLSDITERVISERAIKDLANFDTLTKLPNRRYFVSEMKRTMVKNGELQPCSMFFIDLDKFKEVNDTLGHAVGDKLLKVIAARLSIVLDSKDLICRFGGDEFVVVVAGLTGVNDCSKLAETLIDQLNKPVEVDHHSITIGASIGIACAPQDGATAEDLLQHTDVALYDAKAKGRGTYTFYSEELGDAIQLRRELEIDLKSALENDSLNIHYQPLIDVKKCRITTCEALIRWNHPKHGPISPETFIKIAEESGFIEQLGEYVLRNAMSECANWPENVRVAVNVSAIQFYRSDVFTTISKILAETGLDPNRLEIEVTETVMLTNFDEATFTLNQLSDLGVKISLDDFGTGFSSLSYLHQLPLDKVKIDRSFIKNGIADKRSYTLLKGVVELTKNLGLTVVLEGIETEEQLGQLSNDIKIDEVQGYLFSRPLSSRDISSLLGRVQADLSNTGSLIG
ncbi:MAG: putative bifunctional diguanylate cyclase/phosphodiesterase [Rhizobiaceae bacterium]